jgi:spore maturation protein A
VNIIWLLLITVSVIFAVLNGRLDEFTVALFDAGKAAVEVSLVLLGVVAIWLGIARILENSGLIHKLARFFRPLISRIFRNIPPDHPSIAPITLNLLANMFGLGNAATPMGIQAMQELQTLNPDPETVTFEMMLFIVLNTASIQLLPFTVIGILAQYGSAAPNAIIMPTMVATVASALTAVGILFAFRRFSKWRS